MPAQEDGDLLPVRWQGTESELGRSPYRRSTRGRDEQVAIHCVHLRGRDRHPMGVTKRTALPGVGDADPRRAAGQPLHGPAPQPALQVNWQVEAGLTMLLIA